MQIFRHCASFACADLGLKQNRARTAAAIAAARQHTSQRVLILVNPIEHGAQIATALDAIRTDRKPCLVATSLTDEGLDLPCLEVLILVSGGRSRIKTEQRTGRLLRAFAGKEQGIIATFRTRTPIASRPTSSANASAFPNPSATKFPLETRPPSRPSLLARPPLPLAHQP